jgi:hypothetical protein
MPSRNQEPIGLFAYFEENPTEADRAFFGRVAHADRRGFLRGAGLATMGAMLGTGSSLSPSPNQTFSRARTV